MANPSVGFGLRPARRVDAAALNFAMTEYQIAYNNTNPICTGDLVIPLNTGYIDIYASAALTLGVFMGCTYFSAAVGRTIWTPRWPGVSLGDATLTVKALVVNDPKVVFEIRTVVNPATIADVGANIGLTSYYFKDYAKEVFAIEPAKEHQDTIGTLIGYNKIKNITLCGVVLMMSKKK